jgi:hypothetical protein
MSTDINARKKFTIAKAQENLYATSLAARVGNVDTSKMGTVYNPYTSSPLGSNGTVSDSYALGDYTATADSLEINQRANAAEHVNSYDWKSVDFGLLKDRGMNMGSTIKQMIDGDFLNKPVGVASVSLDAGDFGGTAGTAYGVTNTNIDDVVNLALTNIHIANSTEKKWMAVNPFEASSLRSFLQNTGNNVADNTIVNGITSGVTKVGTTFSGVDVYMTNNLTHVVVLNLATNPTTADTITINGVVITFVATLSATTGASEVHIASTVDITRANLVEFLNADGAASETEATDTGYSSMSNHNAGRISALQLSAVNDNGANTATITAKGTLVVSETLTDATDAWSDVYHYSLLGDYGSINLYLPSQGMDYVEKDVTLKPGKELYMEQFHNSKVWTRMADRIVTIQTKRG